MLTRSLSFAEAFPADILREIRAYPGNDHCCDCNSLDTDWCSISHGTLICLVCAGKHRSLGVLVSFVRSISMDSWSTQQVEMVRQGGNEQIKKFFRKLEIENSPIQTLYCSKGANHYRERLKERVNQIMAGEIKSEPRHTGSHHKHRNAKSQSALGELIGKDGNGSNGARRKPSIELYHVSFGEGPMGMTISKDFNARALVSKLVPGGAAEQSGVGVGDHIAGIAKKRMDNYDEIMHMIPCMKRPIMIHFARQMGSHHVSIGGGVEGDVSTPGKNRNLHGSKSMANLSLTMANVHSETGTLGAISGNYSKPKIRSPRQNGMEHIHEAAEDEADEGTLRSPSGSTKLKSVRSRSKDTAEGLSGKFSFAPAETMASESPAAAEVGDVAERSLTDDRCTPSISPTPLVDPSSSAEIAVSADKCSTMDAVGAEQVGEDVCLTENRDAPISDAAGSTVSTQGIDLYKEINQLLAPSGGSLQLSDAALTSAGGYPADAPSSEQASPDGKDLDQRHVLVGSKSFSQKLTLQMGTPLKVLRNERWRSASMRRMHRDGSFKVAYRDGSTESRVSIERIAMTADTVKALTDWHTCTSATDESEEHIAAAFRAVSMGYSAGADSDGEALSSPENSSYALLSQASLHSFRADDLRSAESFVVESNGVDLYSWIESENVEYDGERSRLSSLDSVLSDDKRQGLSSGAPRSAAGDGYEYIEVVYDQAPLGLRISTSRSGSASNSPLPGARRDTSTPRPPEVTKVVDGGRSDARGIQVGDELVLIDGRTVKDYGDAMSVLQASTYPLRLHFRRQQQQQQQQQQQASQRPPQHHSQGSADAPTSVGLMNNFLGSIGLQKNAPPLALSPPVVKRTLSRRHNVPPMPHGMQVSSTENSPHRPLRRQQSDERVGIALTPPSPDAAAGGTVSAFAGQEPVLTGRFSPSATGGEELHEVALS